MGTYITLMNFTDQGIQSVKETTRRAHEAKEMGRKFNVNMKDYFWTLGKYDLVTICEAPDDESAAAFALAVGSAGNVRIQTLRAFSKDDMNAVIGKLEK